MKKYLLSMLIFLFFSFFLSALQGSLYFLPLSLPLFWCITLAFYSFKKSLIFSLVLNIAHVLVIISFTSFNPGHLPIFMNAASITLYVVGERFHISMWHIALGAGVTAMIFSMTPWLSVSLQRAFVAPDVISWFGRFISTLVFAPPLIAIFESIEQRIKFERIDTLENLRI